MHSVSRRGFMTATAAALAMAKSGWGTAPKIRLSACDWSLQAVSPEGLAVAKRVGLDGLEVSAGDPADVLKIADAALRKRYKEAMADTGLVVSSVAMGLLNGAPFADDPRAPAWLDQTIEATSDLGAKVILLAFFGDGDLRKGDTLKAGELDTVVERLKAAAPKAERSGVILGLENTLSARQNLAILDRVKSPAVQVYYDCGNSTNNGYDVPSEIRLLNDRICQIHFKDGGNYLGQGKVDMDAVAAAIQDIRYEGWVVLETAIKNEDRDGSFRANATYVRSLLGI